MSEKFRKIVNEPHKKLNALAKKIKATKPDNKVGKVARLAGIGVSEFSAFVAWIIKYAALDNHLTRFLENEFKSIKSIKNKKDQDSAIKKVLKKHPAIMSLLLDWIVLTGGVLGVAKVASISNHKDKIEDKKEVVSPDDADYINKAIDAYFPSVFVGLSELETYREYPKLHTGESRYTYYLGLTWVYELDKSGKITKHACVGEYKDKVAKFTPKEQQEQLKLHLQQETLQILKNVLKKTGNVHDDKTIIALLLAGYQRPSDMTGIVECLSGAKSIQDKADAFAYYKGSSKWKNGTLKRRWICAAYATGVIDDNDLLNMHMDAFSKADINTYYRTGNDGAVHFILDTETVTKVLGLQNKNLLVKDFIGMDVVNQPVTKEKTVNFESETNNITKGMAQVNIGDKAYNKGNYNKAAESYKSAIEIDPDNMEAYSSLAMTYIKLGAKNSSISDYENACRAVRNANARMNANKTLLYDADVKAETYFNAGTAREKIADIYKAQGDVNKAMEQYTKAIQNYRTAMENNVRGMNSKSRADLYDKAIKRVNELKHALENQSKKLAFNDAAKKIKTDVLSKEMMKNKREMV